MRAVHVRQLQERIGELALRCRRFFREHVQGDTQVALLHRALERVVVDDLAARRVDEEGTGLHPGEHVGAHQLARAVVERQMHAQHVADLGDFLRAVADLGEGLHRIAGRRPQAHQQRHVDRQARPVDLDADLAPDGDVHAKRLGATRHLLADVAEAEQAERAAVQAARLRVLLLVPVAGAQIRDVVGDAAVEREDEAEGELGHGHRVLAGAVGHVDAARGGRRHVDVVVAGAGAHDEREPPGVEHRLGHLGRAHDEHVRLGGPERLDERRVLQVGLVVDRAAEGLQAVESALLELVGDEHLHMNDLVTSDESTGRPEAWVRTTWTSAA